MNKMCKCLLCGASLKDVIAHPSDDATLDIMKCAECGMIQISPLPTIEEDDVFYQTNKMLKGIHNGNDKTDLELMYRFEKWVEHECDILSQMVKPTDKILELGSGYGWFVKKMHERGFLNVDGLELSKEKCKMAQEQLGINLYNGNLLMDDCLSLVKEKYDYVCMYHVIEHISNPQLFLQRAKMLLKPGGKLVIEVPNANDWLKEANGNFDKFSYIRTHLAYYTNETLNMLLEQISCKNIIIKGVQIYSFENALHWAKTSEPFRPFHQIDVPDSVKWINDYYKTTLENSLRSCAIMAVGEN